MFFHAQVQRKRRGFVLPATLRDMERSGELMQRAGALLAAREPAARALYELNRRRTVAGQYPGTEMEHLVRGHCYNLRDYELL